MKCTFKNAVMHLIHAFLYFFKQQISKISFAYLFTNYYYLIIYFLF